LFAGTLAENWFALLNKATGIPHMTTKLFIGMVSALFTTLLLSDCASTISKVGGDCSIFDSIAVKKTSVVCLLPVISTVEGVGMPQDESIWSKVWKEVDSHRSIILVPLEDVQSTVSRYKSWDSSTACRIAQSLSADTYITTRLNHYTVPQSGSHIVSIVMQMVDCKKDTVIAYAHYTSFASVENHFPNDFDTLREDAIDGVSRVLTDAISKIKTQ
jgi:hypothetical protein